MPILNIILIHVGVQKDTIKMPIQSVHFAQFNAWLVLVKLLVWRVKKDFKWLVVNVCD